VTPPRAGATGLTAAARDALAELVSSHLVREAGGEMGDQPVEVIEAEVLARGRPGIVDLVARTPERTLHLALGLREPGGETKFLAGDEDPVLGVFEDEDGLAVAFDALRDAEVVTILVRHVLGEETDPGRVRQIRHRADSVTLALEDRLAFTVFSDVVEGPRAGLDLLLALDEVGFNHIAAPVAVWRRSGRDLGIIQEFLAGASSGRALAVTSVRDLYASGGPPELAGGDFGAEAHRLGTMAARMHLGLEQAFGRRPADVGAWADALEAAVRPVAPTLLDRPDVVVLLEELRALTVSCSAIRTHGDFHIGRVARTEQGWYVTDFSAAGRPVTTAGIVDTPGETGDGGEGPVYRSPLADVADLLWSLGTVAADAAVERDPDNREGLGELAEAWELRNRRAFFAGYLGVAGISGLVPPGREAVRVLVSAFELERVAARMAHQGRR
jgi:maltokinase